MTTKKLTQLRQHMQMGPLTFTIIWYKLLCFITQINLKVCWWITQLHIWVDLMIICMLHHLPKKTRGNGITIFILHVAQCITFDQKTIVTATLIAKEFLKSLYSRLGFKFIKDFSTYPDFWKARKWFNHESEKYNTRRLHC